jgi:alginate O-acetyltransferase complex protein AlgI
MLGLGHSLPGAVLLTGIIYQPYYLLTIAVATLVVWTGPQTWDWTHRLTIPKAAACFALAWVSLAVLAAQAFNPFIYFIF